MIPDVSYTDSLVLDSDVNSGDEQHRERVNQLLNPNATSNSIQTIISKSTVTELEDYLSLMGELKPWKEWYDSPWEEVFDVLVYDYNRAESLPNILPANALNMLYRRLIQRTNIYRLAALAPIEPAVPFLVDWIVDNWDVDDGASAGEIAHSLLEYATLSENELRALWELITEPGGVGGGARSAWIVHLFFHQEAFPVELIRALLADLPLTVFSWEMFAVLTNSKKFIDVVEEFGRFHGLAEKVNHRYGSERVVNRSFYPEEVRVRAALACYDKTLINRVKDFDLKQGMVSLLKEEAVKAGLDSSLPLSLLVETLWGQNTPGYRYLVDENYRFTHSDESVL